MNIQLQQVLSWLEASQDEHEDVLDDLINHCHPGSCDWLLEHTKMKGWIRQTSDQSVLWLKGKPGSGLSWSQKTSGRATDTERQVKACYVQD